MVEPIRAVYGRVAHLGHMRPGHMHNATVEFTLLREI
jgi:hypothetical protein